MRQWFEVFLTFSCILLIGLVTELSGSSLSSRLRDPGPLAYAAFLTGIAALLVVGGKNRYETSRFLSTIKAKAKQKIEQVHSYPDLGIESVVLQDKGLVEYRLPTEMLGLLETVPLLIFAPLSRAERDEVFNRLERAVYMEGFGLSSRRQRPLITLRLGPLHGERLSEALENCIFELCAENFGPRLSEQVASFLSRRRSDLLLLIDLQGLSMDKAVSWMGMTPWRWCSKVVAAVGLEIQENFLSEYGSNATAFQIPHPAPGRLHVCEIQAEIEEREAAPYRTLALNFVLLAIRDEKGEPYLEHEILKTEGDMTKGIEHLRDWIEPHGDKATRRYTWSRAETLARDFLTASTLYQEDQYLEPGELQAINDDPRFAYVRTFLDLLSRQTNRTRNCLSGFQLTGLHRLINECWSHEPRLEGEVLSQLRHALADGSYAYIDVRDRAWLLPKAAVTGHAAEFRELFCDVPVIRRAHLVLNSGAQAVSMADTLELLFSDTDLWLYFEHGGDLPQEVFEMLTSGGQSRTANRLALLCTLAPHGPAIFEDAIEQLASVVADAPKDDPWLVLATIPLPKEHLQILGWRLLDASTRMEGDLGRRWIDSLGAGGPEVRQLLFRTLLNARESGFDGPA